MMEVVGMMVVEMEVVGMMEVGVVVSFHLPILTHHPTHPIHHPIRFQIRNSKRVKEVVQSGQEVVL